MRNKFRHSPSIGRAQDVIDFCPESLGPGRGPEGEHGGPGRGPSPGALDVH